MSRCQGVKVSRSQGHRVSGSQGFRVSGSQGLKVSGSQGLKVSGLDDRQTRGGGVRCPIGSTVTFDGSSDDLKSRRGDLKSSMRTRDLFWSHWGSMGGAWGSQGVKGSI